MSTSERHYYSWWGECGKKLEAIKEVSSVSNHVSQDSVSVENSLYSDPRVSEAAAVGVPDERLGEQVAAVVTLKPAYQGRVTEADLIAMARHRYGSHEFSHRVDMQLDRHSLPRFAVPVMIVIQHQPLGALLYFDWAFKNQFRQPSV